MSVGRAVSLSATLVAALVEPALAASPLSGIADRVQIFFDGLKRTQTALTLEEYDAIKELLKDPAIKAVLYFNRYGEVRWWRDASKITMPFAEFQKGGPVPRMDLIDRAWLHMKPESGASSCAIPLISEREVIGILYFDFAAPISKAQLAALAPDAFDDRNPAKHAAEELPADGDDQKRSAQYYLDGLIWYLRGNMKRARDSWRKSLELSPGNPESREGLARLKSEVKS